jgi:hypothetical protein
MSALSQWWLGTCPPVNGPKIRLKDGDWSFEAGVLTLRGYKEGSFITTAVTHSEDPYIVPGMKLLLEPVDDEKDLKVGDMLARLVSPEEYTSYLHATIPVAVFATHRVNSIGQDSVGWFAINKPDNFYKAENVKIRRETPKFVLRVVYW